MSIQNIIPLAQRRTGRRPASSEQSKLMREVNWKDV